jgi:peptidoglycan/LPS O-acetylase OafA/YrhL
MIHAVVQVIFVDHLARIFPQTTIPAAAVIVLIFAAASIFAAALLKMFVEDPGRKWINYRRAPEPALLAGPSAKFPEPNDPIPGH